MQIYSYDGNDHSCLMYRPTSKYEEISVNKLQLVSWYDLAMLFYWYVECTSNWHTQIRLCISGMHLTVMTSGKNREVGLVLE